MGLQKTWSRFAIIFRIAAHVGSTLYRLYSMAFFSTYIACPGLHRENGFSRATGWCIDFLHAASSAKTRSVFLRSLLAPRIDNMRVQLLSLICLPSFSYVTWCRRI